MGYDPRFNVEKYRKLAFGGKLRTGYCYEVEKDWNTWLRVVEDSSWAKPYLGSWRMSVEELAEELYVSAVWGWGFAEWTAPDMFKRLHRMRIEHNCGRFTRLGDALLLETTGMYAPIEYAALDRWLESLWTS